MPTETAQELGMRIMSLRQKVLLMFNEDKCGYSTSLIQDRFLHAILVGLCNDNIRHELRPLFKNTIVFDEDILESLDFATADEFEHVSKFKNEQINVHTIKASEDISTPLGNKKQNQKPIEFDFHSLKSTLDDLIAWRINVDQKNNHFQTRLSKPDILRRCQNCVKTDALKCKHCFYCSSAEHLQTGCLKRLQGRQTKNKLKEVASLENEATNFINSDSRCCLFCLKTGNEAERFYSSSKTAKENILKVVQKYVNILS